MGSRWYIVRTKPRAEYLAAEELGRDGFETFFPRVKRPHNRISHADTPLFPGYLFLRCELDGDGRSSFQQGQHVLGWVSFDGEIPSIPDEVVSALRERAAVIDSGGGLWRRYQPGEKVRIVSNKIESLAEVIEEAKTPQARVKVLLSFMGRLVQAQVPWENLQPSEDPPMETNRSLRRTRGGGRWIQGFGPRAVASG
jgi:transcriptional antiterminator RfaH